MKNTIRKKTITFLAIIFISISLIWVFLSTSSNFKTVKTHIPEVVKNTSIMKTIYLKNGTIVAENNAFFKENYYISYTLIQFKNAAKNLDELHVDQKFEEHSSSIIENLIGKKGKFVIGPMRAWYFPHQTNDFDIQYNYTVEPIEKKLIGDSVLLHRFIDKGLFELSLNNENKKDLELEWNGNRTFIFYKQGVDLYFISAIKILNHKEEWISEKEISENLYFLVKNWGVYEEI